MSFTCIPEIPCALLVYNTRVTSPKGAKTRMFLIFFSYIWPLAGRNIAKKGGPLRKLARVRPILGLLTFGSNPDFVISGLNLVNLNKFGRNSSFTRQMGLIIASSRSGTCFSFCLASSTYFSITTKCLFLWYNLFVTRLSTPPTHF